MNIFTVSFFGHRQIDNPLQVESQLEEIICSLLKREEYIEFLVGRDGEFDQLVSSTIRRCKRRIRDDNSALIWVMPYPTAEFRDNEDPVCFSISAGKYFRSLSSMRYCWLWWSAFRTLSLATSMSKSIFSLISGFPAHRALISA